MNKTIRLVHENLVMKFLFSRKGGNRLYGNSSWGNGVVENKWRRNRKQEL